MINSIAPASAFSDLIPERHNRPVEVESKPAPKAEPAKTQVVEPDQHFRLVVGLDEQRGIYIYQLVDRETGRVVTSIPRSEIGKLADQPGYEAGGVVSTSV